MLVLQLFAMTGCGIIAFQDFKERKVLWILFPILGLLLGGIHIFQVGLEFFTFFAVSNLILVSSVLLILWIITHYVFKKGFLDVSFGLGDILFMYAFALGFPTVTFIILLVGAIFFSLLAFTLMKVLAKSETVPLAGLMGIFLVAIMLLTHLPNSPSLYFI